LPSRDHPTTLCACTEGIALIAYLWLAVFWTRSAPWDEAYLGLSEFVASCSAGYLGIVTRAFVRAQRRIATAAVPTGSTPLRVEVGPSPRLIRRSLTECCVGG
jgi:hypothetical protein